MFDESQKRKLWETPSSFVYDKKFDTALRHTAIRAIKEDILSLPYRALPFEAKYLLRHITEDDILDSETTNGCYPKLLSSILSMSRIRKHLDRPKNFSINRAFKLAKQNLELQSNYSLSSLALPTAPHVRSTLNRKLSDMDQPLILSNLFAAADRFRRIVDRIGQTRRQFAASVSTEDRITDLAADSRVYFSDLEVTISWTSRFCVVEFDDASTFLLPSSYILLIHNKLCDLISVLTLILYQSGVCHHESAFTTTVKVVTELARLACRYKDKFAVISGNLESMVIGETLLEVENWENADLLDNIQSDCMTEIRYSYYGSTLQSLLRSASIPLRNELGCLSKLVGHPFVDMKAGAIKLHTRTTEVKELTYESIIWVVNKAKETFVTNYLARHRKWPPCEITSQYPGRDPLVRAMLTNKDPNHPSILHRWGAVQPMDWARVELQQCMEFHQLDNVIPFLKDKSISVFRNQAVRQYLKEDKARSNWEETRLLLYYLLNPLSKLDHQEFLRQYTTAQDLSELADYLIIRLVPKEKEHKIAFRGFGVKSYHDRLRNLAQEKNMAHFLSLYCDEQSMTMGEIEISKKLYAFRTILRAYKGHRVLYVNFDSSGWNNCFRDESVNPVIRETVSRIMGNDCMHRIHEAYKKSLFIIPDGDVTYSWEGQDGGIEGLNQYAWVWVYVNQIKYAMKDLPVRYHMFCKGDDMRLAILLRPELLAVHDMPYWHKLIVKSVEAAAKEFGHKIKVQESYGSEKYFTFSKSASIGQVELPQGFRKIQKVYGANNAMIASLDEYIASTFSNAHSACQTMTNTYGSYFVALVWAYYYIGICPYYADCSDHDLIGLLLVPNMLGGFPIIYLHNMRVRAESDLLSPFLALLQYCRRMYPQIAQSMSKFLKHTVPRKRDFRRILKDPYALHIRTPHAPTAVLRSFILPSLRRKIRNEDIKALISASDSTFNKEIIQSLASARPFDAKTMATIYSASPEGVLGELIRKFESGRSILELIMLRNRDKSATFRRFRQVINTEIKLQQWRAQKLADDHGLDAQSFPACPQSGCPAEWAGLLREWSWGCPIVGISMPPLQHQILIGRPSDLQHDDHALQNHFLYNYTPPATAIQEESEPHWMVGPNDPFLGYRTRTGNISPTVSFLDNDPLIIKVRNLLDLLSWVMKTDIQPDGTIVSSNVETLISLVLAMYTDITPQELAPFTAKRKSGTIQHHARAPRFREAIVPNLLSNWYHNVVGKSDSHIRLRTSSEHYTVNFLHIMCEVIHLMHLELEVCDTITTPRVVWAVTTECSHCEAPISESAVVLSYLPGTTPPSQVLGCQKLDNISKKLILQSYTDFQEAAFKDINHDVIPSDQVAELAVAAEFIGHMYHTHTRLQERFSNHVLTAAAHKTLVNLTHATTSRQIGYTEIKQMTTEALLTCITPVVVEYVMFKIRDFTIETLYSQIQRIATTELPWLPILDALHRVGRLGDVVRLAARNMRSVPYACFENPMSAAPYVGYALIAATLEGQIVHRLSIRTYMEIEAIEFELDRYVTMTKWKLLAKMFFELTQLIRPGVTPVEEMTQLCFHALHICAIRYDNEQIATELAELGEDDDTANFIPINLSQYLEVDPDDVDVCLDDDGHPNAIMYNWLKRKFPSWPWNRCEEMYIASGVSQPVLAMIRRYRSELQIEIGISDIAASIAVLRQRIRPGFDVDDLKADEDYDKDNLQIGTNPQITRHSCPPPSDRRVFTYKGANSSSTTSSSMVCHEPDFSYDKIVLDQAHSHRLYGSATTSMSKLDYVLRVLGFKMDFPDYQLFIVLADGAGGFIEYLATFTEGSMFVFNTLPDRDGANTFPSAATDVLRSTGCMVSTALVDQGIYDLTEKSTISAIMSKHPGSVMVTCDADVKWNDRSSHEAILHGVATIFLRSSSSEGLLVCKANLGFATSVCDLFSTLRRYCRHVWLVRCPGSNVGGEVYIVAHRIDYAPIDGESIIFISTDDERAMLSRWTAHWYSELERVLRVGPDIQLFPPRIGTTKRRLEELPPSFVTKLTTRCGVVLDCEQLTSPTLTLSKFQIVIRRALRATCASLWDNIVAPHRHYLRGVQFKQDSLAHKLHVTMQWLIVVGALDIIDHARSHPSLSKRSFRTLFLTRIDEIPDPFELRPVTSAMYRSSFRHKGVSFQSPYQRYMDGARVAQMILAYEDSRKWVEDPMKDTWLNGSGSE